MGTAKLKTRSVSLTRIDSRKKMTSPPKKQISPLKGKKRKSPPETSPKVSVKERTTRFEQVKNKYRNQRCLKEINREKNEARKDKKPRNDEDEPSIADLLKKLNGNIESMKAELKDNSGKIDNINLKMNEIEHKNAETDKANKLQFEEIKSKVARIETSVTDKVIEIFDPQIKSLKKDLKDELAEEMKTLMEKEMNRRFPDRSPEEVIEKTKNPKKNSQNNKTKKNNDENEAPTGSDSEEEPP